jgi:hypothetical protein
MQSRDHFFRDSVDASAPLLLWALHFFAVYIFVALACGSTLADAQLAGYSMIKTVSLLLSMIAILLVAGLCWRAILLCRQRPQQLLSLARLGCAMLGAIGIIWTSVPMLILASCQA